MHIHFIGIGGIGVSALARLYKARGYEVTGSDEEDSALLEALRDEGMGIFVGHSGLHVAEDTDLVVHSEAIPVDNLEMEAAREREIPIKSYFEALGEFTADFKTIAVAGTHGKTTTVAILTRLLMQAYRDPTAVIGTTMDELDGKNMRLGGGEWMVVEACEYRRSFLHLQPHVVVLTNMEADHLDYYKDEADYVSAFAELVAKLPEDGIVVANEDDENARKVAEGASCEVVYFSEKSTDLDKFDLKVPGKHNLMNAMSAFATGVAIGVEEEMMLEAINSYEGSWRRFEYKGQCNGADVYDDYAHHPTEIEAALQGAREKYPDHRLVAVFEPHQYNRTKHFLEEFGEAFALADEVIIPSIYQVRDSDEDLKAVSPELLVEELQKHHDNVRFGDGFEKTIEYLKGSVGVDDFVLVMGAGLVWKVAEGLVS